MNFQNETTIFLEEFQTSINDAREFAVRFREVWEAIPTKCRHAVATHWSGPGGAPHVWLLRDPKEWNGKGWAASLPDGRSLFFAASVIPAIPPEHLKVFIAHELGHILWIASMEPTHLEWPQNAESMCRCEWLVWQLMKAWGYDQIEAEVWVERHFEKGNSEWVLRGTPLEEAACRAGLADGHRKLERSVTDKSLPNCYYEWQLS